MDDEKQVFTYFDGTEVSLTWQEASKEGFCPACGYFVLGSNDDRTLGYHGVCTQCLDELQDGIGDYDDPYFDG